MVKETETEADSLFILFYVNMITKLTGVVVKTLTI